MEELIKKLNELRIQFDADGVKVYFTDEENYCVKLVKDDKVIKVFRKSTNKFQKSWDLLKTLR